MNIKSPVLKSQVRSRLSQICQVHFVPDLGRVRRCSCDDYGADRFGVLKGLYRMLSDRCILYLF